MTKLPLSSLALLGAVLNVFVLLPSCKKAADPETLLPVPDGLHHWPILRVEGPHTTPRGDTLVLKIICPRSNSCQQVVKVQSTSQGNIVYIKAFAFVATDKPCLCFAVPQEVTYRHIFPRPGLYILEFLNPEQTRIEFPVSVTK